MVLNRQQTRQKKTSCSICFANHRVHLAKVTLCWASMQFNPKIIALETSLLPTNKRWLKNSLIVIWKKWQKKFPASLCTAKGLHRAQSGNLMVVVRHITFKKLQCQQPLSSPEIQVRLTLTSRTKDIVRPSSDLFHHTMKLSTSKKSRWR